jgi:phage N-6-adenine-methyltransferase
MNREDAEEYSQSLGQIMGGSWRQIELAKKLGVPSALGLKVTEWVEKHLGGYVRLSIPERREAVKELTEQGQSTREIGEVLGVDHKTVVNDLKAGGENSPTALEAPQDSVISQVSNGENSPESTEAVPHNHRAQSTGETQWYTPAKYVELARGVLGNFDLDPASCEQAQERIGATSYFDERDDGLSQKWAGRIWLNPPYTQPLIQKFVEKLVCEYQAERVSEAILLTHNYTDTEWFHIAANVCTSICFTRGRIQFESPDGKRAQPTQGQAFFYFGGRPEAFAAAFSTIGLVVLRA